MIKISILFLLSFSVLAQGWEEANEKADCSGDFLNSRGDALIKCGVSPTIKNLRVETKNEQYTLENYSAKITIENLNSYPVKIKTIIVDGLQDGEVSSFCFNEVAIDLYPQQKINTEISCDFVIKSNFTSVRVSASPW